MDSLIEAHFSPLAASGKPMGRCGKYPWSPLQNHLNSTLPAPSIPSLFQIARIDSLFEAHFSPLAASGKPMGRCGKCPIACMDSLFEAHFSPLAASGKPMGRCGKCGRFMRFVPLKPTRLFCPTCEDIFNLPQNGAIKVRGVAGTEEWQRYKLYKELTCPLDNYELVLYSLPGPEGKTFPLCPYCYNHPPFEDLGKPITPATSTTASSSKPAAEPAAGSTSQASSRTGSSVFTGMACTSCRHVSCRHSLVSMGVCPCPDSAPAGEPGEAGAAKAGGREGGWLVL
ncbi:unnamed protein product [Closterium sp. Naga37s-1]|nr:unnamed protein product [Closterium sp. Naga37s-1]